MLIYEKNNKLNINFDPSKSIEDNSDIVIGENEISVSGNNIVNGGSGGNSVLAVNEYSNEQAHQYELDKTYNEIVSAIENNKIVVIKNNVASKTHHFIGFVCDYLQEDSDCVIITLGINSNGECTTGYFSSDSPDGVLHE